MIDTIEFYLHQAKTKHSWVWDSLINDKEGLVYEEKHLPRVLQHKKRTKLHTGGFREVIRFHTKHVPSSHYTINIVLDEVNDTIKFNFSIPKYFYGTNILQAVENVNEYSFNYLSKAWEFQENLSFKRFKIYIKHFFECEFFGYNMDFNDIQITRLDFCYNQFFESKQLALQYLEHQKTFKKKNQRDTSKTANFETSKFFYNDSYSAKVYHKGSEYTKSDRKEHEYINKKFKKQIFDIETLQGVSDKILRYEVSLRNKQLSYLYNNKIFRKDSKLFHFLNSTFNKIKSAKQLINGFTSSIDIENYHSKLEELAKKIEQKNILEYPFGAFTYLYDLKKNQLGLNNKKEYKPDDIYLTLEWFYNKWQTLITTSRKFYFSLNSEEEDRYLFDSIKCSNMFETEKNVLFNKEIFLEGVRFLRQYIEDMQVQQKESIFTYLDRIEEYNKNVELYNSIHFNEKPKTLLHKNKLTLLLTSLSFYSFDDLPKVLQLEPRTWQRYKADLKKIGIEKNVLFTSENWDLPIDFQKYYELTNELKNKLFITNKTAKLFFLN